MSTAAEKKRAAQEAEERRVEAHRDRHRWAISVVPKEIVVGTSVQDAQGFAFLHRPRPMTLVDAYRASTPGGLGKWGEGTTIYVLAEALDHGRLGPGVKAEVGQARKRGAAIEVVR